MPERNGVPTMASLIKLSVFCLSVQLVLATVGVTNVTAQLRMPFRKAEAAVATPAAPPEINLTQSAGPWLVMCASFAGEDGPEQALRVVKELREQHGLNAYVYRHRFDMDQKFAGHGLGWQVDHNGAGGAPGVIPRQMKLASSGSFEEVAVLVGDFADVEDAQAQRTLEVIKSIKPRSISGNQADTLDDDSEPAGSRVRAFRELVTNKAKALGESKTIADGPFRQAFLLPNPLMPAEYFNNQGCDEFVHKLNRGIKYSLLKNPGRYTVRIATFGADIALERNKINQTLEQMESLKRSGKGLSTSQLANAAKKASVLATYLRNKQGIEAYEFHDRNESFVCVGSFDWVTRDNGNGSEDLNPEVAATIQKFQGTPTSVDAQGKLRAKTYALPDKLSIAGITCSPTPKPMLVPHARQASVGSRLLDKFR